MKSLNLFLLVLLPVISQAADLSGMTRSSGKYMNNNSQTLDQQLQVSPILETGGSLKSRSQAESSGNIQLRAEYHAIPVDFEIFDAWIRLNGDLDDDGYYHRIKVTFDADVSTQTETVYAKIYLSHEGGDWYQAAQSELFEIYADSADDTYEILTELIEGYRPGYYEVLIELHSLYHPGIVASRTLSLDEEGFAITLEDQNFDDRYRETTYYETEVYGSGSISLTGLLMLAGLVWIKLRYFSRRKRSIPFSAQPTQLLSQSRHKKA